MWGKNARDTKKIIGGGASQCRLRRDGAMIPVLVLGIDALGDDHRRKTFLEIQTLFELEDEPGESLCQYITEMTDAHHLLLCSDFGFARRAGVLQVRNNATGSDDNDFAPPGEPGCGLDRSVGVAKSVPVTSDEVHVRAKYDATVVYLNGTTRDIQPFLHVNVARVGWRLIVRSECVQANNLLAMEQRFKMVGLNGTPSLFLSSTIGQ